VFARRGDHPRAVAALAHAVERGAVDAQTRYLLGQALVRVGRVEEGRAQIAISQQLQADALAAGRDEFERRALRRAAETALAAGNHADAVAAFERLTAAHAIEWTEQVHRSLAAAYEALGRREDAAHHQERAEQLGTGRRLQRLRDLVGTP
jgi:Flp pilus assembly protein TadD